MKWSIGPHYPLFLLSLIVFLSFIVRAIALFTPEVWIDEGTIGVMSLRAMQGEFPVFFYGQKFMGAVEAYLYHIFFLFFEPSPFTLELLPASLSILYLLLTYILAKRIFNHKVALISSLILALPPYFLMYWTHEARLHYSLVLIFGNIILLLAQKILYQSSSKKKTFLYVLLGFICGVGWWTNYLIITYILPVGFLLIIRNRKKILSKEVILAPIFFFIGSLPLWAFNVLHKFPIFGVAQSTKFSLSGFSIKLKSLFTTAMPIILGSLPPLSKDVYELLGYLILGFIHLLVLIYFIVKCNIRNSKGCELLISLFFITIILEFITGYGMWLNEPCQRYLLPLYSTLPIMAGFFIVGFHSRSKILSVFIISILLFFNVCGNIKNSDHFFRWKDKQPIYNGWKIFNPDKFVEYKQNEQRETQLINFLKTNGYNYIYGEENLRKKFTFKSKETLIVSDPYQEICLKHANLVDGAFNPVFLYEGERDLLEENLKAIGGNYRKIKAGSGYIIYGDFSPPQEGNKILPDGYWKGLSNNNSTQTHNAFDRNVGTTWKTETPQEPGIYYMLDLGKTHTVNKISYLPDSYRDVPSGYQIAASQDGRNWKTVAHVQHYWGPFFWSGTHPMVKIRYGRIESVFEPVPARYIKIILTEKDKIRYWSINEIFVYSPRKGEPPLSSLPKEKDINALISFLKDNAFEFIYADHWLSAIIRIKSNWKIQTITSNHNLGNYGEKIPRPDLFPEIQINPKVGFILTKEDKEYFEKTLGELPFSYQTKEFGSFILYYGKTWGKQDADTLKKFYWSGTMLLKK